MQTSTKRIRLALASLSLFSAAGIMAGPGVAPASAASTCPGAGCKGGSVYCASINVGGTSVSCWSRS